MAEQETSITPKGLLSKEELKSWQDILGGKGSVVHKDKDRELNDKEKAVVALVALGTGKDTIEKTLSLTEEEVSEALSSEQGIELLCKIQDGIGMSPEERICKGANLAVAKLLAMLHSSNERSVLEAARFIVEQAVGKAIQRQEIRNYTVVEDARSIHTKYEAVQGQLEAIKRQRKALLEAEQQGTLIEVS